VDSSPPPPDPPAELSEVRAYAGVLSAARRHARRKRLLLGLGVLLAPTAWVVGTDLVRRGELIFKFDRPHALGYAGSVVESLIFWSVLLYVASRKRGPIGNLIGGLFLLLFTLAVGVEGGFHAFYNIYLSMDGQVHSKSIPWSIVGTLPIAKPVILAHFLGASASARSCSISVAAGCARAAGPSAPRSSSSRSRSMPSSASRSAIAPSSPHPMT
jgi:hypothetical protein